MTRALFASDLHLSPARPAQASLFLELLRALPGRVDALYLLGDLVEFWPGDDDDDPLHRSLVEALARTTEQGVQTAVATGNRDFLMQTRFGAETGARLLPDFERITLGSIPTLLTHGDLLCTRDVQYQQFRSSVRDPVRQQQFLALPLAERRRIAGATRSDTLKSMSDKDDFIMDVEETEVERTMETFAVTRLIHGHTHRPAIHRWQPQDGLARERVVLGDWYEGDLVYYAEASQGELVPAHALIARWGVARGLRPAIPG